MFSSGTGPAPNPGRAIALHLLRNCVLHMSGRMPAAFCVYPTVHIKSERKCICLYIQNVLRAAVVKMCIPYHTHLFIKKVYTLLYIQNHSALPIFPLPAAMCTHMHMHFISKKCTPYHTYQFAGSSQEKKTKRSFAGRLMTATKLRSARALPRNHAKGKLSSLRFGRRKTDVHWTSCDLDRLTELRSVLHPLGWCT